MEPTSRIDTFISTLRIAHKTGVLSTYSSDTPADKLITLPGNVSDLCWEIAVKNLGHTTESAIELVATDGALWFWDINQHPLNILDQYVPVAERVQSLYVATGLLTEWWPNKISPQNNVELNTELERTFTNLAYEAACAIIAHNN